MDLHIIPECYIDTKLIKAASATKKGYNLQKGCSTVVKVMPERFGDSFALGVIDRDKVIVKYIQEFVTLCDIPNVLQLLKHPQRHHFLILVCPAVEKWIILNAEEVGIVLTDFGLPHDFNELGDMTKTSKSENDDPYSTNFQQLFKEIRRKESRYWMILSFWISYLKTNPFTADSDMIIEETNRLLT